MKKLIIISLFGLTGCEDPEAVNKYINETIAIIKSPFVTEPATPKIVSSEQALNTEYLIGRWELSKPELRKEVRHNLTDLKQADKFIKDFNQQYSSIEMEFYEDRRFALYVNKQPYIGVWGISSDNVSYDIQLADDFIELHEVISLSDNELVEIPVAQMRQSGIPAKRLVYVKK